MIRLLLALLLPALSGAYTNVMGTPLQRCSHSGMALTGWTRNGHCVDYNDDGGSHHICIDMASNTGGNFCSVTGQSDWCSSQMSCDGDSSRQCPVEHWCVCQWAFSSYLDRAGGCDHIQDIVCDATNMAALDAYRASSDPKIRRALACLESRCLTTTPSAAPSLVPALPMDDQTAPMNNEAQTEAPNGDMESTDDSSHTSREQTEDSQPEDVDSTEQAHTDDVISRNSVDQDDLKDASDTDAPIAGAVLIVVLVVISAVAYFKFKPNSEHGESASPSDRAFSRLQSDIHLGCTLEESACDSKL